MFFKSVSLLIFYQKVNITKSKFMRVTSKMRLIKGFEAEYKKRHDEIWSELKTLLKETGIADYSIFLDEETNDLFARYTIDDDQHLKELPHQEIMKKWWAYMKDIMETNEDNSPASISLKEVFYLP
jgi:L-rhamnose mutarotase